MKRIIFSVATAGMLAAMITGCSGGAKRVESENIPAPEVRAMKCEFVPAGEEAIIYGVGFKDAVVEFETQFYNEPVRADIVKEKSNDTMLTVIVPKSAWSGPITVINAVGEARSSFWFRDRRNIIIDFDERYQTWGGWKTTDQYGKVDSLFNKENGGRLPQQCSGAYGLLMGDYAKSWVMNNELLFQYMSNFDEGGRGEVSIAGLRYLDRRVEDMVLKFECYVPQDMPYSGVRTEIFSGPAKAEDKHGRDLSVLCFWEPWTGQGYSLAEGNRGKDLSKGFYTNGWETVTIPLTEFKHNSTTDNVLHDLKLDLLTSVNFSFMVFGQVEKDANVFMCVDNIRIVPKTAE